MLIRIIVSECSGLRHYLLRTRAGVHSYPLRYDEVTARSNERIALPQDSPPAVRLNSIRSLLTGTSGRPRIWRDLANSVVLIPLTVNCRLLQCYTFGARRVR